MSSARENFLGRVEAIRSILAAPISTDTAPVVVPNSAAVTIRNGCAVMLFCALEAFVRGRSGECASGLNQAVVPYTHLPEGLRYLSLVSTFEGLVNQTKYWQVSDKIVAFEKAAVATASGSLGSPYQFTDYSFARDKSNVSAADLKEIALAFYADNPWAATVAVWAKVGISFTDGPTELFKQLSTERHKAAHVATHNVPHASLANSLPKAVALAFAFDVLISAGTKRLNGSAILGGTPPAKVTDADISFLTVKPHKSSWGVFRPGSVKAMAIKPDANTAYAAAIVKSTAQGRSTVVIDAAGRLSKWSTVIG